MGSFICPATTLCGNLRPYPPFPSRNCTHNCIQLACPTILDYISVLSSLFPRGSMPFAALKCSLASLGIPSCAPTYIAYFSSLFSRCHKCLQCMYLIIVNTSERLSQASRMYPLDLTCNWLCQWATQNIHQILHSCHLYELA